MEITILNRTKKKIGTENLKKLAKRISVRLKFRSSLTIFFCGDKYCKKMNKKFLKRNNVTDVISFPINEEGYLGDILINLRQVERQSRRYKVKFEEELKRMIIHGILHLCGFDHEKDNGKMEKLEKELFLKFCL